MYTIVLRYIISLSSNIGHCFKGFGYEYTIFRYIISLPSNIGHCFKGFGRPMLYASCINKHVFGKIVAGKRKLQSSSFHS